MSSDNEPMVFDDLAPQEKEVVIKGEQYVLVEPHEDIAKQWRNSQIKQARFRDGEMSGFGNIADSQPLLVSLCLRKKVGEDYVPVKLDFVLKLKSRIVKRMFDWCAEVGELREKDTVEGLKKQIAKLQHKLEKLEGNEETSTGTDASD